MCQAYRGQAGIEMDGTKGVDTAGKGWLNKEAIKPLEGNRPIIFTSATFWMVTLYKKHSDISQWFFIPSSTIHWTFDTNWVQADCVVLTLWNFNCNVMLWVESCMFSKDVVYEAMEIGGPSFVCLSKMITTNNWGFGWRSGPTPLPYCQNVGLCHWWPLFFFHQCSIIYSSSFPVRLLLGF